MLEHVHLHEDPGLRAPNSAIPSCAKALVELQNRALYRFPGRAQPLIQSFKAITRSGHIIILLTPQPQEMLFFFK